MLIHNSPLGSFGPIYSLFLQLFSQLPDVDQIRYQLTFNAGKTKNLSFGLTS